VAAGEVIEPGDGEAQAVSRRPARRWFIVAGVLLILSAALLAAQWVTSTGDDQAPTLTVRAGGRSIELDTDSYCWLERCNDAEVEYDEELVAEPGERLEVEGAPDASIGFFVVGTGDEAPPAPSEDGEDGVEYLAPEEPGRSQVTLDLAAEDGQATYGFTLVVEDPAA
jgi:hypothetical protein